MTLHDGQTVYHRETGLCGQITNKKGMRLYVVFDDEETEGWYFESDLTTRPNLRALPGGKP